MKLARKIAELNPLDDTVAIKTVCPNCVELDWFEWQFLSRLTDPVCGHAWFVGSGAYALMWIPEQGERDSGVNAKSVLGGRRTVIPAGRRTVFRPISEWLSR